MRKMIMIEFGLGAAAIAVGLWVGVPGPVVDNAALSVGIVSVAAGLILLVIRACGRDIQELADRYPWTASRKLSLATFALWLLMMFLGYGILFSTPAGPVLRYVSLGLILLGAISPYPHPSSASTKQGDGVPAR